jgi:isobutyryl-CoA dehydrogenase
MGWNADPVRMVLFEDCKVPVGNLVSQAGNGFKIAMSALDGGRINIASTSLGAAQHCLEKTVDYMNVRKQFNSYLSGFQHLQFEVASMSTDLTSSRLLIREAAR